VQCRGDGGRQTGAEPELALQPADDLAVLPASSDKRPGDDTLVTVLCGSRQGPLPRVAMPHHSGTTMTSRSPLHRLLLASVLMAPVLASAECHDRYVSGQCLYGQSAVGAYASKVVDVSSAAYVNVRFGETVEFRNGNKQFAWTFDGQDRREVDLAKFAPADFGADRFKVYIGMDMARYD
jgi:hypothetical protein